MDTKDLFKRSSLIDKRRASTVFPDAGGARMCITAHLSNRSTRWPTSEERSHSLVRSGSFSIESVVCRARSTALVPTARLGTVKELAEAYCSRNEVPFS